jgi:hypothetical protein
MRNTIDLKRASLILRALHIAVKNASRVHYKIQGSNSVREIPEYSEPSTEHVGTAAPGRPGREAAASSPAAKIASAQEDDLTLYAPSAAPINEKPKYRPDPIAGMGRDRLLADYYGYPSLEAYLAGPEAKRHAPNSAAAKSGSAVDSSANKKPPVNVKAPPKKANGASAG